MDNRQKVLKYMCEDSLLFYARYIYKENHNRKFIQSKHFEEIAIFLEDVFYGKITRGIINMPPRYGKTELVIKIFVSWCLAKVNYSKFIHLSYSDGLALDNSAQTKEYIQSDAFQELWNMDLKKDAQSKKKWFNEFGGGMYATAAGGAITGFGAGVDGVDGFSGAILIDDPLKPDDAFSEIERNKVNNRYNNTIRSRINTDETPIIVIMQRLHEEDLSGFLLDGGSGEEWTHLCLPALDKDNNPLYPHKHTFEQLESIRQADRYTFAGQYQQTPSPDEGGEWRRDWFSIISPKELPKLKWNVYIDGAYTKDTRNDPTGIQVATLHNGTYYILSSIDKYLELPELIKFIPAYLSSLEIDTRMVYVEPKASGKSIVQLLRQETRLNVREIKTKFVSMSKIERARSASPYIEGGRVCLVDGKWNKQFLEQVSMFPNAKHDEHVDLTAYGIEQSFLIGVNNTDIR